MAHHAQALSAPRESRQYQQKLLPLAAGTVLRAVAGPALVAVTVIPTACFATHGFLLILALLVSSLEKSKAMSGIPFVHISGHWGRYEERVLPNQSGKPDIAYDSAAPTKSSGQRAST
jgi:hypothetical protein